MKFCFTPQYKCWQQITISSACDLPTNTNQLLFMIKHQSFCRHLEMLFPFVITLNNRRSYNLMY